MKASDARHGRVRGARGVVIGERVRIETATLVKETNLLRCRECGKPVTVKHGPSRDVWTHGMPEGTVTVVETGVVLR